jgi:hypothetical protein
VLDISCKNDFNGVVHNDSLKVTLNTYLETKNGKPMNYLQTFDQKLNLKLIKQYKRLTLIEQKNGIEKHDFRA